MAYSDKDDSKSDSKSDEKILEKAKAQFQESNDEFDDNRREALDDITFARLSQQWDDNDRRQREEEGRPCLTVNKLPTFIRQVVNDARQNKPSIKTKPADSNSDPETAEILDGLIKNIEYTSNADAAYDTAVDCAVTSGFGYWRVDIDYARDDTFDLDIKIERIANNMSVFGDANSACEDSRDWNYAFIVESMPIDEFQEKYKGKEEVDWTGLGYDDLDHNWRDGDTIQLAEYWCRKEEDAMIYQLSNGEVVPDEAYEANAEQYAAGGIQIIKERPTKRWQVKHYIMTGAEILESNDWPGMYIPIVPVYGDEVNVAGRRYFRSLIRDAKDPQRMFNYWRTASTELVALAPKTPFIGAKGSFNTDAAKWAKANNKTFSYLQYDTVPGSPPPSRQPFAGLPAGALQEALNASDDLKAVMGLHDASLGARGNETSGRAILARQREGDTSTFHFLDNLNRAIRHTGRIVVDLIPHVYTGERMIRVLGEDGTTPRNVNIGNEAQTGEEIPAEQRVYALGLGKYDITVDSGPNFTTRREEAAAQMTELIRAYPDAAPIIGDLIAKNQDWPGADEIAKRLKAMLPPQIRAATEEEGEGPQIPPEAMQQMQQMQEQMSQMQQIIQQGSQELQELRSEKERDAEKIEIDRYKAETDRLKVTQETMSPEQIQATVMQTLQDLAQPDAMDIQPSGLAPPDLPLN